MAAVFPAALKTYTTKVDGVTDVMAVDINSPQEEIVAIETELGTDPAGTFATVKARFVDDETKLSNLAGGWVEAAETWTYASAVTFTISGDQTGKYQKGDKIKLTQTTVKYFYIVSVSYGAPNTTVTVAGGTDYSLANAAITAPYYSKAANPQGFPGGFSFTPSFVSTSATFAYTSQLGKFSIQGGKVLFELLITLNGAPGGTTSNTVSVQLPVTNAAGFTVTLTVYWNVVTLPANMTFLVGMIANAASTATLRYTGSGQTSSQLLASGLGSNAQIGMSGQFLI